MKRSKADLRPVADIVSARVFKAMLDASSALTALGVRHALVGGLAVGAHGWRLLTPERSEGVPVAPVEALVYLKLVSPRAKDRVDVIELVKAGLDRDAARRYLQAAAPALVDFDWSAHQQKSLAASFYGFEPVRHR